jgi:hypothetical protein
MWIPGKHANVLWKHFPSFYIFLVVSTGRNGTGVLKRETGAPNARTKDQLNS